MTARKKVSSEVVARRSATTKQREPKSGQMERTVSAVLDATIKLLGEVGYRSLTIDQVSQRSGVARSTIYRYWKNLPELAIAAFDAALGPNPPAPDKGNIRDNLCTTYFRLAKYLRRSIWGQVLPSLIEASHNDPAFKGMLERLVNQRREGSRQMLRKAKEEGQLKSDTNIEWVLDTIAGILYYRLLLSGGDLDEEGLIEWAIDTVLQSVATETADG